MELILFDFRPAFNAKAVTAQPALQIVVTSWKL